MLALRASWQGWKASEASVLSVFVVKRAWSQRGRKLTLHFDGGEYGAVDCGNSKSLAFRARGIPSDSF
jgi:hypothetical protein